MTHALPEDVRTFLYEALISKVQLKTKFDIMVEVISLSQPKRSDGSLRASPH